MQWSDSEAKFMLGFLNDSSGQSLKDHHHGYQHDRGFQPEALEIIYHFYAQQLAYLLQKLSAVGTTEKIKISGGASVSLARHWLRR